MTAPAPAIRLTGIRKSIPPGYTLGRITAGIGDVQLVRHDDLAVKLAQTGQVLSPTTQQWQAGNVSALDSTELVINSTTITLANRGAGTLMGNPGTAAAKPSDITIGTGLTLSAAGTLSATGGGGTGTVTNVATGAGLSGGPITTSGTIVADWQGGTVTAKGSSIAINSGTIDVDQAPTYFSASRTLATTDHGSYLVDKSTGTTDLVVTLPTLTAGTKFWADIQNNSTAHIVRLRPAGTLAPTIDGVANSDYLLPTFSSARIAIDATGTAYVVDTGTTWWQPSAGYVSALNGLEVANNGTFDTNGTLQPKVDGTSIILSGGTLSSVAGAKYLFSFIPPSGTQLSTVTSSKGAIFTFDQTVTIYAMHVPWSGNAASRTLQGTIATLNASNVVQSVVNSGSIVVSDGKAHNMFFDMGGVVCSAGTPYAFLMEQLAGQATLAGVFASSTSVAFLRHTQSVLHLAEFAGGGTAVAVGNTLSVNSSNNALSFGVDMSF